MTNFSDNDIYTIMSALADQARRQRESAEEIEAKMDDPKVAEALGDMVESLREGERKSESLRADFAGEYHQRGRTDCDLAHQGRPCPNKK